MINWFGWKRGSSLELEFWLKIALLTEINAINIFNYQCQNFGDNTKKHFNFFQSILLDN